MYPTFEPLKEHEIEVKVKQTTARGATLLLYKNARTDMDRLDREAGAENWACDYKEIKGNLYCGIGVRVEGEWIWKWDCGVESRADDGNEKKGEASDAFKRAGFRVGIGRELYTAPPIFVTADKLNLDNRDGRYRTFDAFSVEKIAYDGARCICGLAIRNDKTGKRCFVWKRG